MCEILKVSRSGYYSYLSRPESSRTKKNKNILAILLISHNKAPMAGLDFLWHDVTDHISSCRSTVYRIMKKMELSQNAGQNGSKQQIQSTIYQ